MDLDVMYRNVRALMEFKGEFDAAAPDVGKFFRDLSSAIADLNALKKDFGPALEWAAEQQKKEEAAKGPTLDEMTLDKIADRQGKPGEQSA